MKKSIQFLRSSFFIWIPIITGAFLVSCKKDFNDSATDEMTLAGRGPNTTIVRNPLYIPSALSPTSVILNASQGTKDLGGGILSKVWQYNGSLPGPTIIANKGDNVSAVFQNNLPEESIIHWHGMLVNHQNDGQPIQAISPGSSYSYSFPILNRAALNWYHPHPHMLTGKQVFNGLAGGFIIRDAEETALNLPGGKYEVPLVIRDATVDKSGNLNYKPSSGGIFGKFPLVNGTKDPYFNVDKAVYRFRVLIGSNSRVFGLSLSNGSPFIMIGNDGGLLPVSSNQNTIEVAPGERLDLLIDFRSYATGTKIMLRDLNQPMDLLEFRVTGNTVIPYTGSISTSSTIIPLSNPVNTRLFSFDGMSKINGLEYEMNRIDFNVPFGQTELWQFKTNGNGPHPVHVHGASFQVVSRTGGRGQVFPWERGWKDVVLVNDSEIVSVLIRFDSYRGIYLIHCHKLEHEDMGMMTNFEVQ